MIIPYIKGLGVYVPEKKVSNDELSKTIETSDEWIYSHTGIRNRHMAADDQTTSDMAVLASEKALENCGMKAEDIDQIILATTTPDYIGFPSTACVVQDKLKAANAAAFDIFAACSGFVYGIDLAKNLIATGSYKNILVIGVEQLTKITNWDDRGTCVLLGDGAGAAVVSGRAETDSSESAILNSHMKARGSGAQFLIRKAGGIAEPITAETKKADTCLAMNGRRVYNFAVEVVSKTITKLLDDAGISIDDIKHIVPHQANVRILEAVSKRTSIPVEKFYMNIEEYANTSSASIPLALNEAVERGNIKRGDYIILVGFGGGLTYGGTLVRW